MKRTIFTKWKFCIDIKFQVHAFDFIKKTDMQDLADQYILLNKFNPSCGVVLLCYYNKLNPYIRKDNKKDKQTHGCGWYK